MKNASKWTWIIAIAALAAIALIVRSVPWTLV
jgi:hypothetical protein